jgi:hypothetical protein
MIQLETGRLSPEELECLFGTLPLEITFADSEGIVRYYNRPPDAVFTRSADILGRSVVDCHPPEIHPAVERVLEDLKSGRSDVYETVKRVDGRVMHIRYIAARNSRGTYLGCLEVAQDITRIKTLEPEVS